MEQLQLLDGLDTGRPLSVSHRRKCYPEKEGTAAFGQYWGDESRSAHLHRYLHTKTSYKSAIGFQWNKACLMFILKALVQFQNENVLIIYSVPCHPRCKVLSLVKKKWRFLRKMFQDFSPHGELLWWFEVCHFGAALRLQLSPFKVILVN